MVIDWLIWFGFFPLALYLMVDSGTDFTFRRPQKLFILSQGEWLDYEGNIVWLLLVRFLTGLFLIIISSHVLEQILLLSLLALLEILAGRLYLPKMKRD